MLECVALSDHNALDDIAALQQIDSGQSLARSRNGPDGPWKRWRRTWNILCPSMPAAPRTMTFTRLFSPGQTSGWGLPTGAPHVKDRGSAEADNDIPLVPRLRRMFNGSTRGVSRIAVAASNFLRLRGFAFTPRTRSPIPACAGCTVICAGTYSAHEKCARPCLRHGTRRRRQRDDRFHVGGGLVAHGETRRKTSRRHERDGKRDGAYCVLARVPWRSNKRPSAARG